MRGPAATRNAGSPRCAWVAEMRLRWPWKEIEFLVRGDRRTQSNREYRSSSGCIGGFDGAAVLLHDRLTDAQSKSGSPPGAFGGVEGIEDAGQNFSGNPWTIILKAGPNGLPAVPQPYA